MKTELVYSIYYYVIIKRIDELGVVDFIVKTPNGRDLGPAHLEDDAKCLIIDDIKDNKAMENKPDADVNYAGDPNAEFPPESGQEEASSTMTRRTQE